MRHRVWALDARILFECAPRGSELRLAGAPLRLRGSLGTLRGTRLEFEPHRRSEMARERLRELLLRRHGAHQLMAWVERETDQGAIAAKENAMSRELPRGARELQLGHDRRPGRALLGRARGSCARGDPGGGSGCRGGGACRSLRRGSRAIASLLRSRSRTKGEHPQECHGEAARRCGRERKVAATNDCRLIVKLHILGRERSRQPLEHFRRVKLIALIARDGLAQPDTHQESRERIQHLRVVGSELLERLRAAQQLRAISACKELDDAHDVIARNGTEHRARLGLPGAAAAESDELIEERERIAEAPVGRVGEERHCDRIEGHALGGEDGAQVRRDVG